MPIPSAKRGTRTSWSLEQPTGDADILGCVGQRLQLRLDWRDGPGGGAQAAADVQAGLEIDLKLGRELGIVTALVGAATLGAGQRAEEAGLGGGQGGAEVQGMGEVAVAFGAGPHVDLAGQLAELGHPLQAML